MCISTAECEGAYEVRIPNDAKRSTSACLAETEYKHQKAVKTTALGPACNSERMNGNRSNARLLIRHEGFGVTKLCI